MEAEKVKEVVHDLVTLTHRVARVSNHPLAERVFFNILGRALEFEEGTPASPGSPQDVPECVAKAILGDPGLAPHFRCEPITAPAGVSAPPTAEAPRRSRGPERDGAAKPAE